MKPDIKDFFFNKPEGCKSIEIYQHWDRAGARLIRHAAGEVSLPSWGVDYTKPIMFSLEFYSDGATVLSVKQGENTHTAKIDATHIKYVYDVDFGNHVLSST